MLTKAAFAAMTIALFVVSLAMCVALCVLAPPAYFLARLVRPRSSAPDLPF